MGALLSVRLREVSVSGGLTLTNNTTLKLLDNLLLNDNTTEFRTLIAKFEPHATQQFLLNEQYKFIHRKLGLSSKLTYRVRPGTKS